MFASPPTVNYDEVESAGIITFQNNDNELDGNPYVLSDNEAMELVQKSTDAYNARDWEAMSALYTDEFKEKLITTISPDIKNGNVGSHHFNSNGIFNVIDNAYID